MLYSVCGAPLDDWANSGSVDIFFTCGEYGFGSMGSSFHSREWVWNLKTKLCCIASGKWDISRVSLQGFGIRYVMF